MMMTSYNTPILIMSIMSAMRFSPPCWFILIWMEKRLTISTVPIYIVYLSSHSGGTSVIGGQSVRLTRRGMALPLTHIAVTNSSASTLYSALQTIFLYTLTYTKKTQIQNCKTLSGYCCSLDSTHSSASTNMCLCIQSQILKKIWV